MIKIKKYISILLIAIILAILILNSFGTTQTYAVRSIANDLSNLVNYPTIYTLVRELQTAHPTWNFTVLYTGLDWKTVIENETTVQHSKSLVQTSVIKGNKAEWKCPICGDHPYDNGSWRCASTKTVSYYMDVRNWLNEDYIFSMESHKYDPNIQTVQGVQKILAGTFMDVSQIPYIDTAGNAQVIYKSYSQIIIEAAQKYGINPYALASRLKQEQGSGESSLISGTYLYTDTATGVQTQYVGYYNYFNINASGDGTATIIKNGLEHAKTKGWTTPELAIHGGAEFLVNGYLTNYQDTLYLQKYTVDPNSDKLYAHQYMQNVSAPFSEGLSIRKGYVSNGTLENEYNFIIPVYENMPAMAAQRPGNPTTLVSEYVKITTSSSPLTVRSAPESSASSVGTIPKNATALRIEKASTNIGGYYWDKVIYINGNKILVGYASSEYLTPTEETENVNTPMITTEMCNIRNYAGTTDSDVIKVLPKDTQLTIINSTPTVLDGHTWYRVKLADGTKGYVSKSYMKDGVVQRFKIEPEKKIVKVIPGVAATEIPGLILNGATFGTGASVTIDGVNYTLVMIGDIDGNGEITPLDYVKTKNHIMKVTVLQGAYAEASDVTRDGDITPLDYVKIKNHIMNISKINL